MPDIADVANEVIERTISNHIHNHVNRTHLESAHECDECGKDIPEGRRLAVNGTQHCVDCAEYYERKRVQNMQQIELAVKPLTEAALGLGSTGQ